MWLLIQLDHPLLPNLEASIVISLRRILVLPAVAKFQNLLDDGVEARLNYAAESDLNIAFLN